MGNPVCEMRASYIYIQYVRCQAYWGKRGQAAVYRLPQKANPTLKIQNPPKKPPSPLPYKFLNFRKWTPTHKNASQKPLQKSRDPTRTFLKKSFAANYR